jgi:phage tail sheath protein FI
MAEFVHPGVYLEEIDAGAKSIEGVGTSTPLLIGIAAQGPKHATLISRYDDFTAVFGDPIAELPEKLRYRWTQDSDEGGQWWQFALSVKGFFDNGGRRLLIKRVTCDDLDALTPNDFVAAIESSNLIGAGLCLAPGMWSHQVQDALIARCETRSDCFAILDPPPQLDVAGILEFRRRYETSRAALYYPWLDIDGKQVAPSAHIAGIYARVDSHGGVHKAPANEEIQGVIKFAHDITEHEQEALNPQGINVLRSFPGRGNLLWGARTLSSDPEWKYVNVRRFFTYLERSIDKGTRWAVFEPNNEQLWANVRRTVSDFLLSVWQTGALQGEKPERAYFVKCDRTTMTQEDLDNGRLICLIGVAVVKPAEFVIFRIGQWTADRKD